jgi:hypothetical protein
VNLLNLRNRIKSKAIQAGLTYSEIETLFDVNELLNQTMPCLMWNYEEELNDYALPSTEMTLRLYLITNLFDAQKTETGEYQRDYIVTEKEKLRRFYIDFIRGFQTDDNPYIEVLRDRQLQLAERVSIEGFLIMEALPVIRITRDYCLDVSGQIPICDDAIVENSDQSFQVSIAPGDTEVLVDYEFEFQDSDGNIIDTEIRPAMIGETFIVGAGGACPTVFNYDLYVNGVFYQTIAVDINQDINITT